MSTISLSALPGQKTVLIIEDDLDVRDAIEGALARVGYQVLTAGNGADALAILRAQPIRPSLILLDWMMPVMDGMGFLGQTASDPRYASIPIVVVSAVTRMVRIPTLCVAAVVPKPVRLRTLVEIVDRLCEVTPRGGAGRFEADPELDRVIGSAARPE